MTKKLKLSQITHPDFSWAMMQLAAVQVEARGAYWISKIFRKIESHQKHYDKARLQTLNKYAKTTEAPDKTKVVERDKKGDPIWLEKDSSTKFEAELKKLQDEEVEIPTMQFSLLGPEAKVAPNVIMLLEEIIIMEDQP